MRAETAQSILSREAMIAESSSTERPDAVSKTTGQFAYSSDIWVESMLWGATLRSALPRARILSIDVSQALRLPGVRAVLTHRDVPGRKTFGLNIPDQPVLASSEVRYLGEPIAIVAAEQRHLARRALQHIVVSYDELEPITDPEAALDANPRTAPAGGNLIRHLRVRRGDPDPRADVVVRGTYEVGIQDQAALGPESALALPTEDGGIEIYVSTQCLYEDLAQICASLDMPPEKVRLILSGIGGAFGGKEDISVQIHCSLLALATGCPVRMVYARDEAFVGRPHRHPAKMEYEHRATRDGRLVFVKARIVLDGGAYASTSSMVAKNAGSFAAGPYSIPNVHVDCYAVYTNNPPAGSMRGMGATQVCFGYEAQMNRLADELGVDPIELRLQNALADDSALATGQTIKGASPVGEILRRLRAMPMPASRRAEAPPQELPGGRANVTHGEGVSRGVGYAIGIKGFCFSEGREDYSTARVRLSMPDGLPLVEVQSAAAEMGQGVASVQVQVARMGLHVDRVALLPADTSIGSAGSSSASRQTYMTGGAVEMACRAIREELFTRVRQTIGWDDELRLTSAGVVADSGFLADWEELLDGGQIERTAKYHHARTYPLDPETGQGEAFVSFMFAAHRAVVDVDRELGLVRVVELATVQDVGRVISLSGVEGQIEGGSAQGLGLALMEEVQVNEGRILNASFTDYLIPTMMDMPPVKSEIVEFPDPVGPLGVKGAGEAPTVSSGAAVVGAIEQVIGQRLSRVPVRPQDIVRRLYAPNSDG